jgi:hypothetical protein
LGTLYLTPTNSGFGKRLYGEGIDSNVELRLFTLTNLALQVGD